MYNVTGYLNTLRNSSDASSDVANDAAFGIVITLVNATLKFFKIEAAKKETPSWVGGETGRGPYADLGNALIVYDLVFLYFFVAAGLTLVLMAVLMVLGKRGKMARGDWIRGGVRVGVGAGLSCVSVVKTSFTAEERFIFSPWMVPTVMLGLGGVVLGEGVLGWVLPARRGDGGGGEVA